MKQVEGKSEKCKQFERKRKQEKEEKSKQKEKINKIGKRKSKQIEGGNVNKPL